MASTAWAAPATPEQLFKDAQKAEKAGQILRAYVLYSQAAAADPANLEYWQRAQALRPIASLLHDSAQPAAPVLPSDKVDTTLFGKISEQELARARQPLPPPKLNGAPGVQDYDLSGDSKALWEQVAARLHLSVLFDTQYQPTRSIRFQLASATWRDTLLALEAATNSFLTPVSERLIFVANDTQQKRTEFDANVAVVIPFSETSSVQELQEVATGVRGTLDMQKVMVDTQRHLILMRDRVTKVRLAEKIFQDLMRPHAQVAIDIDILTTDRTSNLNYGLTTPTAFPLVSFVARNYLRTAIPSGFPTFLAFGGGASLLGLGVTSAQLFANVAKSSSDTVLSSEVVALEGQPSTLHVGNKYPLVTNTYIGGTTGTASSGQVYTPPPTFSFEDLGLVLKVTPWIHGTDEVTLEVDAEFKLLGAGAVDGIPIISSRKYTSKVRLRTGEWGVLAGLMTKSETNTITGIPGLSLIPLLRSNTTSKEDGATLIVLKPHLLVLPPTEYPTWRAWSGTETRWASSF
ncbi:MAG TPA: type II and III secretion system protein [Bryobacteraceae bacterium]|nr:type II and III secretion system protein [Bryobacteraceae bacterium]